MECGASMIKILVGSKNPVKIGAVMDAFSKYFTDVNVTGIEVASGVANQPKNEETFTGAENRAMALMMSKNAHMNADFFVGIEGGIMELHGHWFAFGAMCVIDKDGRKGYGMSPHLELPDRLLRPLLDRGLELGEVIDEVTGENNTKQKKGAVGYLTRDVITRRDFYVSGLVMAIAPFLNEELYFGPRKLKNAE